MRRKPAILFLAFALILSLAASAADFRASPGVTLATGHFAYLNGMPNGLAEPNRPLTRAEGAALLWRCVDKEAIYLAPDCPFDDVSDGDWFFEGVSCLAAVDAFRIPAASFRPNDPMTRAEFVDMLVSALSVYGEYKGPAFSDIRGHASEQAITTACSFGWVNGYEEDGAHVFDPDAPLTRAHAVAILNRAMGRGPFHFETPMDGGIEFPDNKDISAWYYYDILEASNGHSFVMEDGHEVWTSLG